MNWRRVVIGVVVVAVLSAAGFFGYQQFLAPQGEEGADTTSSADDIALVTELDVVSAEGQVVPLAQTRLAFTGSGAISEILVAVGDEVAAGDPLLRLDTIDQDSALAQATAAVHQAEANLAAAQAGLQVAEAGLTSARAGVAAAEAQLALTTAEPSAAQIALSEANVGVSAAGVTQAAGNRAVVLEGPNSAQIQAAEARLAAAEAQLFSVRLANEPIVQDEDADETAREQAALRLNAAQNNVLAAQTALAELRAGATADEAQAANSAVGAAANQRQAAEAELALLLAGARPEEVTVTAVSVSAAESAVAEAELGVAEAETAVLQAEAALAESQAAAEAAQIALDRRTLTAPFAGVVAAVPVKIDEVVTAGVPVLTVADFSEWHIETTDLTELGIVNIARGFEVEITIDAFPGQTLQGEVIDIAEVSDVVRGDVTYVTTIALLAEPPLGLRWGMTAFVSIPTGQS